MSASVTPCHRSGRHRGWLLAVFGVLSWLAACQTTKATAQFDEAERVASAAQDLVNTGDRDKVREAIDMVDAARKLTDDGSQARALLDFTKAWLCSKKWQQTKDPKDLEPAIDSYLAVLATIPTNLAARRNLVLLYASANKPASIVDTNEKLKDHLADGDVIDAERRSIHLTVGDIHLTLADMQPDKRQDHLSEARKAFQSAYRIPASDDETASQPEAALRIIGLAQMSGVPDDDELLEFCGELRGDGNLDAAARGYEVLMAHDADRDERLEDWLAVTTQLGAFHGEVLRRLAELPQQDWPALRTIVSLLTPASEGPTSLQTALRLGWFGNALATNADPLSKDLRQLLRQFRLEGIDKSHPPEAADGTEFWLDQRRPRRQHLIATAIQNLAARELLKGGNADKALVTKLYWSALCVAPDSERYDESQDLKDLLDHDSNQRDAGLDIAIDLAVFYQTAHDEESADSPPGSVETTYQVDARLLLEYELGSERFDALEHRTPAEKLKYYGLLGDIVSRGWLDSEKHRDLAILLLREAVAPDPDDPSKPPLPKLERKLAELLGARGSHIEALTNYVASAKHFAANGANDQALANYEKARKIRNRHRTAIDDTFEELEQLLHPRLGIYLGASGGLSDMRARGRDIADDLSARGYTNVSASIDGEDFGYKLFGGYRFDAPLALELSYVDLGKPDSSIMLTSPGSGNVLQDVEDVHPISGQGYSLGLVAYPYSHGDLSAIAKVGGWIWDASIDVALNASQIAAIRQDGIDPFLGIGLQFDVTRQLSLRAEWERYFLDSSGVDLYSFGLALNF